MTQQHFKCIACGKCCYGWVPLTIGEAFAHAVRFPLAMVWTPVKSTSRSFDLAKRLGTDFQISRKQSVAIMLSPVAYVPPSMACPALTEDNLCSIHDNKPLRCRAMPFAANVEEADQAPLLVPRKGWQCDVSRAAPVVYDNKKIVDRAAFDDERQGLLGDAVRLRAYAQKKLSQQGPQFSGITAVLRQPVAGRYIENFSSFARFDKGMDMKDFARVQCAVLAVFAARTKELPELQDYHRYYAKTAEELAWYSKR